MGVCARVHCDLGQFQLPTGPCSILTQMLTVMRLCVTGMNLVHSLNVSHSGHMSKYILQGCNFVLVDKIVITVLAQMLTMIDSAQQQNSWR